MTYSMISILALILNVIINRGALKHFSLSSKGQNPARRAVIRYTHFLTASNCYFIADIIWGVLYEYHHIDSLFPFLYLDCILYFLFMFLTMLTWIRYVVAFINKTRKRSKILLGAVWFMFTLGLIFLIINLFFKFIFSFDGEHNYIPEPGRYIAFLLQIALYLVTTVYMFYIASKSIGGERIRYTAVGFTCFAMGLFLVTQIFDPKYPAYAGGLIIGICVIRSIVDEGEKKEKEIYDHIATSLAEDYEAMYYIDMETGQYMEFSTSEEYESMNVPCVGKDFYAETQSNLDTYVHPDDREFARSLYTKEKMLSILKEKKSYSYKYRIMVGGSPRYFRFTVLRAHDDRHFVLYEKDIDEEVTAETTRREKQEKHITFSKIAESLAANYDVIYYVDAKDSGYVSYECHNIYGKLDMQQSGDDFFADAEKDIPQIVHESDRNLVSDFLDRDNMISALKDRKRKSIDYRIMANDQTHHVRLIIRKTSDDSHFIIGVENIDAEIRREKEHLKALNSERELARRDDLTGVKNKTAYNELVKSVQENIDNKDVSLCFAMVVCDANNLKRINDTQGHVVGDEYIKKSAMLLCDVFAHSPVFRVGGDEFVVFLKGDDYSNRGELMKNLRSKVIENIHSGSGPVLASGISEYDHTSDSLVSEVFDRADKEMYDDKQELKE